MMCEKCNDMGFIISEKDGIESARECECQAIERSKRMFEKSGLSEEFQKVGFKNFDVLNPIVKANVDKAIDFYKEFMGKENLRSNSILFSGQVGSGKTMLSMAISNNLMNIASIPVVYMPYRDSVTQIKQYMTDDKSYNHEMDKYKKSRVLMIDDLLKGKITESDINILFEIINYRYINYKPMIISTEKSVGELLEFDEAIASRIIEMCKGNIVTFEGKELNYRIYGGVKK